MLFKFEFKYYLNMNIDDIPIGNNSNKNFEQMLEEYQLNTEKEELDEEMKPLSEKIISKNWKTRKSSFLLILEELTTKSNFADFQDLYIKILDDQHTGNQETALDLILVVAAKMDFTGKAWLLNKMLIVVIEKSYTSSKLVNKQKSKDIIIFLLEKLDDTTTFCESIKSLLEHKNTRVINKLTI